MVIELWLNSSFLVESRAGRTWHWRRNDLFTIYLIEPLIALKNRTRKCNLAWEEQQLDAINKKGDGAISSNLPNCYLLSVIFAGNCCAPCMKSSHFKDQMPAQIPQLFQTLWGHICSVSLQWLQMSTELDIFECWCCSTEFIYYFVNTFAETELRVHGMALPRKGMG